MDNTVFNMAQLLNSTCEDRELAGQVAGVFLGDLPVQLADLEAAIAAGDAKTAERIAHSIKGAAATVGGEGLRAAAMECERLGRENKLDELFGRMAELRHQCEILKNAIVQTGLVE